MHLLPGDGECSICLRLEQEETFRIQELAAYLSSSSVAGWVSKQGVLCHPHGWKLRGKAPASARDLIDAVIGRTRQGMRSALDRLIREGGHGSTGQNGILGRAAEYLVAQRGGDVQLARSSARIAACGKLALALEFRRQVPAPREDDSYQYVVWWIGVYLAFPIYENSRSD